MSESNQQEQRDFNARMNWVGYVNSLETKHKADDKDSTFNTARINVLSGREGKSFAMTCIIVGTAANNALNEHRDAINDENQKVIVSGLCDVRGANAYTDKEGQTRASVDARLYFVNSIKIDGKEVYKASPKAEQEAQGSTP